MRLWLNLVLEDPAGESGEVFVTVISGEKMDENEPGEFEYDYELSPQFAGRKVLHIDVNVAE